MQYVAHKRWYGKEPCRDDITVPVARTDVSNHRTIRPEEVDAGVCTLRTCVTLPETGYDLPSCTSVDWCCIALLQPSRRRTPPERWSRIRKRKRGHSMLHIGVSENIDPITLDRPALQLDGQDVFSERSCPSLYICSPPLHQGENRRLQQYG